MMKKISIAFILLHCGFANADEILLGNGLRVIGSINGNVIIDQTHDWPRQRGITIPMNTISIPSMMKCEIVENGERLIETSIGKPSKLDISTEVTASDDDALTVRTAIPEPDGRSFQKMDDKCYVEMSKYKFSFVTQTIKLKNKSGEAYIPYTNNEGKTSEMLLHVSKTFK